MSKEFGSAEKKEKITSLLFCREKTVIPTKYKILTKKEAFDTSKNINLLFGKVKPF